MMGVVRGGGDPQMKVDSILRAKTSTVETIEPQAPVARAARQMSMLHIGALVVSRDGTTLTGLVSERDIVYTLARRGHMLLEMRVRDVMRADPPVCHPDDSVVDVMAKMTRLRVRHLPVIDRGTVCGIVSIGDIVKQRLDETEQEIKLVREAYIGRG
jgi:CBS domain-containing protein